jgi:hypothetical protein
MPGPQRIIERLSPSTQKSVHSCIILERKTAWCRGRSRFLFVYSEKNETGRETWGFHGVYVKIVVFYDMTKCCSTEYYQRFEWVSCLHPQDRRELSWVKICQIPSKTAVSSKQDLHCEAWIYCYYTLPLNMYWMCLRNVVEYIVACVLKELAVDSAFYHQKLALTSPTSGGLSVGIVRSRTKPPE